MTLALVDCPTGLAGDMLLAALFDLGLDEAVVHQPLQALGLAGRYRLERQEGRSGGLRGLRLRVESLEDEPPHRHWRDLKRLLGEAPLEELLRQRVLAVFGLLAEAEAAVHGHAPEAVHFHEVGALDALVDIVGVCAGLLHFGVERLICAVPPAGHGSVVTAHGRLPLPAPAVLEIARRCAIPLAGAQDFPPAELTTPTGLALMACWAERFGPSPAALPERVGVGLGCRELDRPNQLRITLGRPWSPAPPAVALAALSAAGLESVLRPGLERDGPEASRPEPEVPQRQQPVTLDPEMARLGNQGLEGERLETVVLQQCQIDDASGEDLAFLLEELQRAGALDVFSQPIGMKKGRPGILLTALAPPEAAAALRRVWWRHSSSLGVRESLQPRWVLERSHRRVSTPLGEVGLKQAPLPGGGARVKIEHDDLVAIARRQDLPLAEVRHRVHQALIEACDPWFVPPPPDSPDPQQAISPPHRQP